MTRISRSRPLVTATEPPGYRESCLKELKTIPGVGPSISEDLWNAGIRGISDLRTSDPQELYDAISEYQGKKQDRCLLYVLRCAVYFASNREHDPELLKWWNWKEERKRGPHA